MKEGIYVCKKHYKIIIMMMLLLVFSGCSVTYNLDIDENYIDEETSIMGNSTSLNNHLYEYYKNKPLPLSKLTPIQSESNKKIDSVKYYTKNDLSNNGLIGLQFIGKFDNVGIDESSILSFGVGDIVLDKTSNKISITVPTDFKAFKQFNDLENVTVNIKSKYKVLENNADSVNNGIYTWNITRDDYDKDNLSIVLDNRNYLNNLDNPMVTFSIAIFAVCLIVFLIYLLVRRIFLGKNSL